jgi:hypothetical protein
MEARVPSRTTRVIMIIDFIVSEIVFKLLPPCFETVLNAERTSGPVK